MSDPHLTPPDPELHDVPVPRHVAVIMDGNGRWAREQALPRQEGHRAGMEAVREVIHGAVEAGVKILTLFAFSTENWFRPEEEILSLMALLRLYADQEREELRERSIRVRVLGDLTPMADPVREAIRRIEEATRDGDRLLVNLMISYSGRAELVRVARTLAERVGRGELAAEAIEEADIDNALDTRGLPDPDLLIRTSGEFRISNFMLWQLAYTELHFTPVLWPDFTREHLCEAVREFQRRDRRFGRVPSAAP
jgi:undecaprenyl diphosphate synthase